MVFVSGRKYGVRGAAFYYFEASLNFHNYFLHCLLHRVDNLSTLGEYCTCPEISYMFFASLMIPYSAILYWNFAAEKERRTTEVLASMTSNELIVSWVLVLIPVKNKRIQLKKNERYTPDQLIQKKYFNIIRYWANNFCVFYHNCRGKQPVPKIVSIVVTNLHFTASCYFS